MSQSKAPVRLPDHAPPGPALFHCDTQRTHLLVAGAPSRSQMLQRHLELIRELSDGRAVWVPTFNYDFCRTGRYDVAGDRSQVGVLTEAFRTDVAGWRTRCPVFNFAGTGVEPDVDLEGSRDLDPFDIASAFGQLVEMGGSVVWYGAPFSSTTLIHHAERTVGGPHYRYDKLFTGVVTDRTDEHAVQLRYHVRPMGQHLNYDWPRLVDDLLSEGVVLRLTDRLPLYWSRAAALVQYWAERLHADPLYLLDPATRGWVEPELERLGRRFELSDFE